MISINSSLHPCQPTNCTCLYYIPCINTEKLPKNKKGVAAFAVCLHSHADRFIKCFAFYSLSRLSPYAYTETAPCRHVHKMLRILFTVAAFAVWIPKHPHLHVCKHTASGDVLVSAWLFATRKKWAPGRNREPKTYVAKIMNLVLTYSAAFVT